MKKHLKRVLSLLLCLVLASALSTTALSAQVAISKSGEDAIMNELHLLAAEVKAVKELTPALISLEQNEEALARIEARINAAILAEEALLAAAPADPQKVQTGNGPDASVNFANGSGTEADPYLVTSRDELSAISVDIANGVSAYYRLDTDINLGGTNWTPIGNSTTAFTGHLDGNGYAIQNLTINETGTFVGLFGFAKNATIKNLKISGANIYGGTVIGTLIGRGMDCTLSEITIENCIVRGGGWVAGLAGILINSTITDCSNNGHIISSGDYAGGMVSNMLGGLIERAVFTGVVDGARYSGGIAGQIAGNIKSCNNAGNIKGTVAVGGIAGELSYVTTKGDVRYCYNSGDITGISEVGGIAGFSLSQFNTSTGVNVVATANIGAVHASSSYAGGIIGDMSSNTYILTSYNRGSISANSTCGGIVGRYNEIQDFGCSVSYVYNAGKVRANSVVGSLIGYCCATVIQNAYYLYESPDFLNSAIAVNHTLGPCQVYPQSSAELKNLVGTLLPTWYAEDTDFINDGYPILLGINYSVTPTNRDFKFRGNLIEGTDTTAQYFYLDSYFSKSANEYNEHLATMSLSLALSAFASYETGYETQYINAQHLLENTGFSNIAVNDDFTQQPAADSIGVITGKKVLTESGGETTLIAVAIRGSGYESEWAGNVTIGEDGFHQGFATARDKVLSHLRTYIQDNAISGNVKIWITGFSRAAATANLVAGALNNGETFPDCTFASEDVYAYTFETPRGVLERDSSGGQYSNIYNITWENDLVPKVAPAEWGFSWYNNSLKIPTKLSDQNFDANLSKMLERFNALGFSTSQYLIDDFEVRSLIVDMALAAASEFPIQFLIDPNEHDQEAFLNELITAVVVGGFKSRTNYVDTYQQGFREAFLLLNAGEGRNPGILDVFAGKVRDHFAELMLSTGLYISAAEVADNPELLAYFATPPLDMIRGYLEESALECGTVLSEAETEQFIMSVGNLLLTMIQDYPYECANLLFSMDSITQAHYPEICLAWMQSMDSNFTTGGAPSFVSGDYRIARINGPVDVNVYDGNGELVSAVVSGESDAGNRLLSRVNNDGETLVYLPAGGEYNIRMEATDDGDLSYAVNEYSASVSAVTRVISFDDVALDQGMSMTADIPAIVGDTDLPRNSMWNNYSLNNSNGQDIQINTELVDEDAVYAYYLVEASSENADYGMVLGGGVRQFGSFARVNARAFKGIEFIGWYDGSTLVSANTEYSFKVESDVTLTAKFEPIAEPLASPAMESAQENLEEALENSITEDISE